MEKVVHETRQAIEETLGYIERQEDGPVTMRHALKDIDERVSAIENEINYLVGTVDHLHTLAERLFRQHEEAIRQRNILASGEQT